MALLNTWMRDGIPASYFVSGVNLREFGFELNSLPEAILPDVNERTAGLSFRHGAFDAGSRYGVRRFTLGGQVIGIDHADVVDKLDRLIHWFALPNNLQQFHINGMTIRGLRFEIKGHQYPEDRFLVINYSGGASITNAYAMGHFKGRIYNVSIPVGAAYPFWVSDIHRDTYRETIDDQWIRIPESGDMGTAESYPEVQISGPTGANAVTISHGLFGANVRFADRNKVAGTPSVPGYMSVTEKNIYDTSVVGALTSGPTTPDVPSDGSTGSGRALKVYGNSQGSRGDSVRVPLCRGSVRINGGSNFTTRREQFLSTDTGTLALFFRAPWEINNGVCQDTRTKNLLSVGREGSALYQLRIRFRNISGVMKLELYAANSGAGVSVTN